jgi:hypothetical protein
MTEKQEKKPFYQSKLVVALLLIWAIAATLYTVTSAATNFNVKTPILSDLLATQADISVENVVLSFNIYNNRYLNATIDVKNNDNSANHQGVVQLILYDIQNLEIATGSESTGIISPGVRLGNIVIDLVWIGSYTVTDFARGKVTVTQLS